MVLDAAKGVEERIRKLYEVCRLHDLPIITFVNKLDREARDPFDLLDEAEQSLALDVTQASSPIGMGRNFLGTYEDKRLQDEPLQKKLLTAMGREIGSLRAATADVLAVLAHSNGLEKHNAEWLDAASRKTPEAVEWDLKAWRLTA